MIQCCQAVTADSNQSLSSAQKELLDWHHKLCLNMKDLQQLMRPQQTQDDDGRVVSTLPPIIPTKFVSMKNVPPDRFPLCLACKLSAAKARGAGVKKLKPVAVKEGIQSRNKYEPGDMISAD